MGLVGVLLLFPNTTTEESVIPVMDKRVRRQWIRRKPAKAITDRTRDQASRASSVSSEG